MVLRRKLWTRQTSPYPPTQLTGTVCRRDAVNCMAWIVSGFTLVFSPTASKRSVISAASRTSASRFNFDADTVLIRRMKSRFGDPIASDTDTAFMRPGVRRKSSYRNCEIRLSLGSPLTQRPPIWYATTQHQLVAHADMPNLGLTEGCDHGAQSRQCSR